MQHVYKSATREDVQSFADWLEIKGDMTFNLNNSFNCAIAQYLKETTGHAPVVGMDVVWLESEGYAIPSEIKQIAYGSWAASGISPMIESAKELHKRAIKVLEKMPA